jgi:hypothetical protein
MSTRIKSLGDLPQEIEPKRDLWPAIEAAISTSGVHGGAPPRRFVPRAPQFLALAASVAALAIGVWIGRNSLPIGPGAANQTVTANGGATPTAMQVAFMNDPVYRHERSQLVRALETQLAALPPETQTKVAASLQTIRQSMKDLEAALGKDPSNALLQELLVNTYQEEMRVLSVVKEASSAREEI